MHRESEGEEASEIITVPLCHSTVATRVDYSLSILLRVLTPLLAVDRVDIMHRLPN